MSSVSSHKYLQSRPEISRWQNSKLQSSQRLRNSGFPQKHNLLAHSARRGMNWTLWHLRKHMRAKKEKVAKKQVEKYSNTQIHNVHTIQVDTQKIRSEDKTWFMKDFNVKKHQPPDTWLCGCAISHHLSQIITGYLLSPRGTVVVVIAVVVVVAAVVVVGVVVVGAAVVVGGGGGAGVGNRRCQGKVDQGWMGFTLTLCNNTKQSLSDWKLFGCIF